VTLQNASIIGIWDDFVWPVTSRHSDACDTPCHTVTSHPPPLKGGVYVTCDGGVEQRPDNALQAQSVAEPQIWDITCSMNTAEAVESQMAQNYPVTASGSREPEKRPRPIPKAVRAAIKLMVHGDPDDQDGRPLPFIEAGKQCGIKPDTMRRYIHRPDIVMLLRAERKAFREAICAGNEGALLRVRETSPNGMAVIGSVRALEHLSEEDGAPGRPGFIRQMPGLTVVINAFSGKAAASTDAGPIVDVTPAGHEDEPTDPTAFKWPR
jgi:hypothetical protein